MKIWESEILTINVKPGWKKGTKITFPDKGNEQPNQLPADLVFVIDEKPHDLYKRDGDDHIVNRKVSVTSRGTWGMSIAKEPGNRGDLRIKFDVKFPTELTPEQRAGLRRVLGVEVGNLPLLYWHPCRH
ncbi:hypothetical protein V6N13_058286 [Hibiscus sabdariffa]